MKEKLLGMINISMMSTRTSRDVDMLGQMIIVV